LSIALYDVFDADIFCMLKAITNIPSNNPHSFVLLNEFRQ
jgi:hypothetical protein